MNLIRRHKGLAIVGCLALVLLIIMFIIFARMIFTSNNGEYGNRLNGLIKVDKSIIEKVTNDTKKMDEVEDITVRTQGKIIYTTIIFKENVKKDKAKEIANNTLKEYTDEIKKAYDFEFFITQNIKVEEGQEDKSYTVAEQNTQIWITLHGLRIRSKLWKKITN